MYWYHTRSWLRRVLVSVLPDECTSQGALQTALVIVSLSIALTSVLQMAIHQLAFLLEFQKQDESKCSYFAFIKFHLLTSYVSKVKAGQGCTNHESLLVYVSSTKFSNFVSYLKKSKTLSSVSHLRFIDKMKCSPCWYRDDKVFSGIPSEPVQEWGGNLLAWDVRDKINN